MNNTEDTSVYIFDYFFPVRVKMLEYTSVDYLRANGRHMSGVAAIDRELDNQWLDYQMTISQMVEEYDKGVSISIVKYSDTKIIYEYITNHLNAMANKIKGGVNIGDLPIDDLIKLDKFAAVIYEHAKGQYTIGKDDSEFSKYIASMNIFNTVNIFDKPEDKVIRSNDDYPVRESLANLFNSKRFSTSGRRWE